MQNTKILEKSVLKNIRGDDKLYILGHGHVAGEYIGNERFDVNYLSHLYSCSQQSHTSPACKADIECSLEKDEYSTPEAVAKSLKGFVPRDFSRFYTLTCHSGEARRPISLSDEDLKRQLSPTWKEMENWPMHIGFLMRYIAKVLLNLKSLVISVPSALLLMITSTPVKSLWLMDHCMMTFREVI